MLPLLYLPEIAEVTFLQARGVPYCVSLCTSKSPQKRCCFYLYVDSWLSSFKGVVYLGNGGGIWQSQTATSDDEERALPSPAKQTIYTSPGVEESSLKLHHSRCHGKLPQGVYTRSGYNLKREKVCKYKNNNIYF